MSYLVVSGHLCKTIFSTLCIIGVVSLLFISSLQASTQISKEQKLKAAYLLNFTKFIEWHDKVQLETTSNIRICVDDSSEFLTFFSQMVGNKRVGKTKSMVSVISLADASGCELIYIQGSQKPTPDQATNAIVVADIENNSIPNVDIFFYTESSRLRFEIDLEGINELQITVSSELLKLARIK